MRSFGREVLSPPLLGESVPDVEAAVAGRHEPTDEATCHTLEREPTATQKFPDNRLDLLPGARLAGEKRMTSGSPSSSTSKSTSSKAIGRRRGRAVSKGPSTSTVSQRGRADRFEGLSLDPSALATQAAF